MRFIKLAGVAGLVSLTLAGAALGARTTGAAGPVLEVSARCGGQNAEVEQASDPTGSYVYEVWIGCHGIGFARSSDGGAHFARAITLRDSGQNAWDPAVTVGSNCTVYASFMVIKGSRQVPVVLASFDHGGTFPQRTALTPHRRGNWGDRDFIAAGPGDTVYLTWDYGPSDSAVRLDCFAIGSCAIRGGDLNIVVQVSTNGGRTFGPMIHVSPGFPTGGADSAPVLVEPDGRIDVLYQRFRVISRKALAFGRAHSYFTASTDGGRTWSRPVMVGPPEPSVAPTEWWIDGDLAIDSGGNLYATWDTQSRRADVGWISYSTDHGATWSRPVRVVRTSRGPNTVEAAGGPAGSAYVGWQSRQTRGYSEYLSTFSIARNRVAPALRISRVVGRPNVWPGDTFGISVLAPNEVMLSWGTATASTGGNSEIFARRVRLAAAG